MSVQAQNTNMESFNKETAELLYSHFHAYLLNIFVLFSFLFIVVFEKEKTINRFFQTLYFMYSDFSDFICKFGTTYCMIFICTTGYRYYVADYFYIFSFIAWLAVNYFMYDSHSTITRVGRTVVTMLSA